MHDGRSGRAWRGARLLALLVALPAVLTPVRPAAAEDPVSFRGRNIRMVVGAAPGGITDLGARLIGRFLAKYLPGTPAIVVQNMPGAGGISSVNYFVQQVAPDGLTFIGGSSSEVSPDVIRKNPAVKYDPTRLAFIGGIANAGSVLVASNDAIARLRSRTGAPVAMAQVSSTRVAAQVVFWGAEYLGWNIKWISGYQGNAEFLLALKKGEVDMVDTSGASELLPLLREGYGAVAQMGVFRDGSLSRRALFPDTPLFSELVEGKIDGAALAAYRSWLKALELGKFFALPPGTPEPILAAYRRAYRDLQDDADFKSLADKQLDPDYVMLDPEATRMLIAELGATPDADLQFLVRLREKYTGLSQK
jgi:tripartite-type tricarboxylate transporter receptor subunit TctC